MKHITIEGHVQGVLVRPETVYAVEAFIAPVSQSLRLRLILRGGGTLTLPRAVAIDNLVNVLEDVARQLSEGGDS